MSTSQDVPSSTQYAAKKRKRPQPRNKNATIDAPVKSNPSKRHRDRLNTELERLSQLIPLPDDVVSKLDKLSILRLSVAYLRNKSYSKHIELEEKNENKIFLQPQPSAELSESEMALQALDGFIIVVTQDFSVFYITSTVQQCLGFPQTDVIYQSMLDLIHAEDRKLFMKQMLLNPMGSGPEKPPEDGDPPATPDYVRHGLTPDMVQKLSQDGLLHRSFICRLRCLHDTSSGFLALHFTGHLGLIPGQNRYQKNGNQLPPELGLFLLASPLQTPSILEIRTKSYIFRTKHKLDYTPLNIDQKGRIVLGYTEQELRQQSGYQFIHSADMMHCADAHTKLMRKGQSGLTVFRLLHRANRWQWVTASARLICNKGIPEYIISTHRPITEQEGEEHLKKRSVAFRFDFTGHASLYASVNPIGAGPPPSNNRSHAGASDTKPHPSVSKRPRVAEQDIDPATLYGAQSLQSMENYPDGLPNIKPTTEPLLNVHYPVQSNIIKSEDAYSSSSDAGYFERSPGSSMLDFTYGQNGVVSKNMTSPRSDKGDSGLSDNDIQSSPSVNDILESLLESSPTQQQAIISPNVQYQAGPNGGQCMSNYQSQDINQHYQQSYHAQQGIPQLQDTGLYNTQPTNYYPHQPEVNQSWAPIQNQAAAAVTRQRPLQPPLVPRQGQMMNGMARNHGAPPASGLATNHHTPLQGGANINHNMPPPFPNTHQQMPPVNHTSASLAYGNRTAPMHQTQYPLQDDNYQQGQESYQQSMMQQREKQAMMYQQPQLYQNKQPSTSYPGDNATKNFMDQLQAPQNQALNGFHNRRATTSMPKENISVLNAVEISSTITNTGVDQGHKELRDMVSMLGPQTLQMPSSEQFEISLECQEHTIQFDMDKIAAEFQTSDPMSVIQNHVQNNPTDALALATGNLPDSRLFRGNGLNSRPLPPSGQLGQYQSYQPGYSRLQDNATSQLYAQQQQPPMQHLHPAKKQMPEKNEHLPDDLDEFNLEDFLTYDAPNIQG